MSAVRNKSAVLKIDIPTRIHKKYLGEANDLHFVPDSPLIERQHFTPEEESEITRLCTILLADVPHSDDTNDDPVAFLISQKPVDPDPRAGKLSKAAAAILDVKMAAAAAQSNKAPISDTATPSETSKRDTFNASEYCTPMTSAGITPGETTKRFSDMFRRPGSNRSNKLRKETSINRKSVMNTNLGFRSQPDISVPKSDEGSYPFADVDLSKRTLRLVHDISQMSESHIHSPGARSLSASLNQETHFDLNKSLPVPPSIDGNSKQRPISRLFDTMKKKRSLVNMKSHVTNAATSPHMHAHMPNQHGSLYHGPSALAHISQIKVEDQVDVAESKRKFRLRFFGRRNKPAEIAVS